MPVGPTRHSTTEYHRATDDTTGANITAGFLVAADGAGFLEFVDPATIIPTNVELNIEGGQDVIKVHGSMGSTETFDPTDGNVHTGTLDANCVFTINAPTGTGAATLELWITGSGTRTWTWPGSVTWDGGVAGSPPASGATVRVILETIDGGTNWIANMVGGSGTTFATPAIVLGTAAAAGAATTTIRSDSTIVAFDATVPVTQALGDSAATGSAAVAARRDHKHGMPALSTATPLVESGTGAVGTGTLSSREDHVHPAGAGTSATDANIWRPVLDGAGAIIVDGTGQAVMAYGPA